MATSTVKTLEILFDGSFQCRLATDPAPANASPEIPTIGPNGRWNSDDGWTFPFDEKKFDRVIRLSRPVQLRGGLMFPWADTQVRHVRVDTGYGSSDVSDPLVDQVISLGKAKFDALAGNGPTREALTDFRFKIGDMLSAGAKTPPVSPGLRGSGDAQGPLSRAAWNMISSANKEYYQAFKLQRVATDAGNYHPVRLHVIRGGSARQSTVERFSQFFQFFGPYPNIELASVDLNGAGGVLSGMRPANYSWVLDMTFFAFDGDTLVGRVYGTLKATKQP